MMRQAFLWIVAAFILVLAARLFFLFGVETAHPTAHAGVLDLRSYALDSHEIVALDGEWEFYPGEHRAPGSWDAAKARYISVPGSWDDQVDPGKHTPFGIGTYRLKVLLPDAETKEYGMRLRVIRSAHTLFVNGQEEGRGGQAGLTPEETEPQATPYAAYAEVEGQEMEIVLHVSNFDYGYRGGVFDHISLGDRVAIEREDRLAISQTALFAGLFFFCGLYALLVYIVRRDHPELLYFSLIFWLYLLFWITYNEKLLYVWAPDIPYIWQGRLQILSSIGIHIFLFMALWRLFPEHMSKRLGQILLGLTVLACVFFLVTDTKIFTRMSGLLITFDAVLLIASLAILSRAVLRSKRDSREAGYLLAGVLCILYNGIQQAITYLTNTRADEMLPVEIPIFMLLMAVLISQRFFRTLDQVEALSQQLLLADRVKNDFMVNTSHELRTPLYGMMNIAQALIEEGDLRDHQAERLTLLISAGRGMSHLLEDILDLAKLQEGTVELRMRPVDVRMAVGGVIEVLRHLDGQRAERLVNQIPIGYPDVRADNQRLMQVLFHLVRIAMQAANGGEVRIRADVHGEAMRISIMGETTKRKRSVEEERGVQFSLQMCRKLIRLHGGELSVFTDSAADKSLFEFTMPVYQTLGSLSREQRDRSSFMEPESRASQPPGQGARVLLVEEDPVSRSGMYDLLVNERLQVTAVTDGEQAIRELEQINKEWDLVILDVVLPRINGYEVSRRIRERYSFYDLPVLFLTQRSQPADLLVGFEAGANDYVTKPIDASEFKARVRTLLKMKETIQEKLHVEMALIQAQIKPHFLFNTLNTIASLSEIDPDKMRDVMMEFGHYLRSSFDLRNLDKRVSFATEWALVKSYLYIEQARFGDRMQVHLDIPDSTPFMLPPLTIQPLVENALRHGILKRFEGGVIAIRVKEEANAYIIHVHDNGEGFPAEKLEPILSGSYRQGIGMVNVHRRLKHAYGQGLRIESVPGQGTTVSFSVPKERGESMDAKGDHNR